REPTDMRTPKLVLLLSLPLAACAGTAAQIPAAAPSAPATIEPPPPPPPAPTPVAEAATPELAFPADEAFRSQQPGAGSERPLKAPHPDRFKLPNGVSVFLVERHNIPIVSMSAVFEGGSALDPKGKEGFASVCAGLMSEGTEKLPKLAFEEALADIASQ